MRCVISLALLSCAAASAQQAPTAEQLLAAYVDGLGGPEKLRAMQAVAMKGTLDNPDDGSKVPVEVQAKAPNFYSRVTRFSDTAVYRTVFAGNEGWQQDPDKGVHSMNKTEVANARLDYDLHRALRLREFYPKLGPPARKKLGDKDTWSVEAAADDGAVETWWFDPATAMLLCREYERVTLEDGIMKIQEFYADYKDFAGVRFPTTVRQVMPDYELRYHFDEVKLNTPVEQSLFAKPK